VEDFPQGLKALVIWWHFTAQLKPRPLKTEHSIEFFRSRWEPASMAFHGRRSLRARKLWESALRLLAKIKLSGQAWGQQLTLCSFRPFNWTVCCVRYFE
jgi:hypothetical protein